MIRVIEFGIFCFLIITSGWFVAWCASRETENKNNKQKGKLK